MGAGFGVKKTAVVLLNLGGPLSPEGVYPFLFSLFYDPLILTLPNPFRYLLAKLIARVRLPKARAIYAVLGGASPLLENTQAQAMALEKELGTGYRVFVAMRHAPPVSRETVAKVRAYNPDQVVLLPLYPQYSTTTTESSLRAWKEAAKGWEVPTHVIESYPAQEGFLEAMKELIGEQVENPSILFVAHGLPEKTIKRGDPYQAQVEETARALERKLLNNWNQTGCHPRAGGDPDLNSFCATQKECVESKEKLSGLGPRLRGDDTDALVTGHQFLMTICYQSRVGPLKWIGPSLEEEILKTAAEKRPLVVVPISFVSEHSETLVELDVMMRDLALSHGCPSYIRISTVQTHPLFIKGLASLVVTSIKAL